MADENNIGDCCKQIDPCQAACMLNNVLVDLAMGKSVTAYTVGGESFRFARPKMSDVKSLLQHFQSQCNLSKGKPSRERGGTCFIFGESVCGTCRKSSCRCR